MAFVSPIALLKSLDISIQEDPIDFAKAKKKLLAAFELNEGMPIKVDGEEINKTDALQLLNDLKNPEKLQAYSYIHEHPALSLFLTEGKPQILTEQHSAPPAEVLPLISENFALEYDKALLRNFKARRNLQRILAFPHRDFILPAHQYLSDKKFHGHLRGIVSEVHEINQIPIIDRKKFMRGIRKFISEHLGKEHLHNWNRLPADYQDIKLELFGELHEITVTLNNKYRNFQMAYQVVSFLRHLKLPSFYQEQTKQLYEVVKGNRSSTGGGEKTSSGRQVWGVLVLIVLVIRLIVFLSRGSSSSTPSSYETRDIQLPPAIQEQLMARSESLFSTEEIMRFNDVKLYPTSKKMDPPASGTVFPAFISEPLIEKFSIANHSDQDALVLMNNNIVGSVRTKVRAVYIQKNDSVRISLPRNGQRGPIMIYQGDFWADDRCAFCEASYQSTLKISISYMEDSGYFQENDTAYSVNYPAKEGDTRNLIIP